MNEKDLPYIESVNRNWEIIDREMTGHKNRLTKIERTYKRLSILLFVLFFLQLSALLIGIFK